MTPCSCNGAGGVASLRAAERMLRASMAQKALGYDALEAVRQALVSELNPIKH